MKVYFQVKTMGDAKVCEKCAAWQDKILTLHEDGIHELVDNFAESEGLHPNCRCVLQPIWLDEAEAMDYNNLEAGLNAQPTSNIEFRCWSKLC